MKIKIMKILSVFSLTVMFFSFSVQDIFASSKTLRAKFQIEVIDDVGKRTDLFNGKIGYFDSKGKTIGFCTIDKFGNCSMNLLNKKATGTNGSLGIIYNNGKNKIRIPYDFETDEDAELDYGSSDTLYGFSKFKLIFSGYGEYHKFEKIVFPRDEINDDEINDDEISDDGRKDYIKGEIDPSLGLGYIRIIDGFGKTIGKPFYIKKTDRGTFFTDFKIEVDKSMFDIGMNYSVIFEPKNTNLENSGVTQTFVSYSTFLNSLSGIYLNSNKRYKEIEKQSFPYFGIGLLVMICGVIVFIINKKFVSGLGYLRCDPQEIGKIVD